MATINTYQPLMLATTNGIITIPTVNCTIFPANETYEAIYNIAVNEQSMPHPDPTNEFTYKVYNNQTVSGNVYDNIPTDGAFHLLFTLSNGNYCMCSRASTYVSFKFYLENGTELQPNSSCSFNYNMSGSASSYCGGLGIFLVNGTPEILAWYVSKGMYESAAHISLSTKRGFTQQFIEGAEPVVYNWTAWDQIAGYHGQYICNLTKIKNDEIGDITSLVQSSDVGVFSRLSPDSNIWDIYRNMPLDTDVTIAWSGVGYLMLRVSNVQGYDGWKDFTFKFFYREAFANVPFYTYTVRISVGVGGGDVRACYLAFVYDAEEGVAAFTPVFHTESNYFWGNVSNTAEEMGYLFMWLALSGSPESQKPYDTGTEDDGGNPSGVKPQDHIGSPASPILDAAGSGLFTVYCPTDTELSHIADYLWDNDIIENMHKYFNNFSDNIISLYVLPYKPSNNLTKVFQVGNLQSSDSALAAVEYISGRFAKIDMGEYTITPFWDSYLDYSPYTKLEIYLPGVGIQSLDPDDIMCPTNDDGTLPAAAGSTISLEYMIDLMTGILVAYVKVNSEVRYQFPGKVGYQIPLTGENYTRLMTGFVSATAGLIGTIATGGTAAPFAAAASTAGIINAMKPDTYRGGNLSGDASMLSGRTPFLIYRRPNKPRLTDQDKFTGFPSYKIDTLSNFSGYTEVIDCHVEGISCTDEEREKILAALKGGVII